MEFVIDTVDINYNSVIVIKSSYRRCTDGNITLTFDCNKFISLSMLAQLKHNKQFFNYLKLKLLDVINDLSNEDFQKLKDKINNYARNCFHHNDFTIKLIYWNEKDVNVVGNYKIYYKIVLDGFKREFNDRIDLVDAANRMTFRDILKR